jgi:hypothetical protein
VPNLTTRQANAIAKDLNGVIARIQANGGPNIVELREAENLAFDALSKIRDARLSAEAPD